MSDSGCVRSETGGLFVTTSWTRVLAARGDSPEAHAALSELCAAYYTPVLVLMRQAAPDKEAARDLTHEFFCRLLSRQGLDTADAGRGRFRYFLLGAVKHFLSDYRAHGRARKRGGGRDPLPLQSGIDTSASIDVPDLAGSSPEREFDRRWALALLDRALNQLAAEQTEAGKREDFETLKPWLTGDKQCCTQAETAARLGVSAGALKVAVHRLRKRFRVLVKAEIANTVDDPAEVTQELRYLLEVLSSPGG